MEILIKKIKREIVKPSASNVWRCCKCREEMYRGENYCNYCKHSKCSSCKRLEI